MFTISNKKPLKAGLYVLICTLIGITSCKKKELFCFEEFDCPVLEDSADEVDSSSNCEAEFTLYAGQSINVGSIVITNDDDNIYVTYNTTGGWVLNETHLFVGELNDMPATPNGNPKIGLFPYKDSHNGVSSFTLSIPINEDLECYVVAAHASVSLPGTEEEGAQTETAWSTGEQINESGSWATYSEYCLSDCCEYETVEFEYFAGQHISVGSLSVTNDEENLYITYNFDGDWHSGQTHLYVGSLGNLPVNGTGNPIPGQFPYSEEHDPEIQSFTYTIPLADLDECYIIAAHAELTSEGENGEDQTETGWSSGTEFPNATRWGWYSEYCTQICE